MTLTYTVHMTAGNPLQCHLNLKPLILGVSQNQGYLFVGRQNKDYSTLVFILGTHILGHYGFCKALLLCLGHLSPKKYTREMSGLVSLRLSRQFLSKIRNPNTPRISLHRRCQRLDVINVNVAACSPVMAVDLSTRESLQTRHMVASRLKLDP